MSIIHTSRTEHLQKSHIPARLAAGFAKGYKKAARTSSAASLYPFAVRGGFEPPVR